MDFKRFNATWQNTISSNRMLVLANLVLVAVVGMQQVKISSSNERIVITPVYISEKMEVAWNEATPTYYKSIGQWLAATLAGVDERNITFVTAAIEQFFAPAVRRELLVQINEVAKDPMRKIAGSTVWFEAREILWEEKTKRVFVSGDLLSMNVGKPRPEREKATYEFKMRMKDGRPEVIEFTSYSGPARTLTFLQRNKLDPDDVIKQTADVSEGLE